MPGVAVLAALFVVLVGGRGGAGCGAVIRAGGRSRRWGLAAVDAVVSEIQTGGASASDEFAEITNVGAVAVDLAGLEVVYVTSTGGTVTRKATWTTAVRLHPGRHL